MGGEVGVGIASSPGEAVARIARHRHTILPVLEAREGLQPRAVERGKRLACERRHRRGCDRVVGEFARKASFSPMPAQDAQSGYNPRGQSTNRGNVDAVRVRSRRRVCLPRSVSLMFVDATRRFPNGTKRGFIGWKGTESGDPERRLQGRGKGKKSEAGGNAN